MEGELEQRDPVHQQQSTAALLPHKVNAADGLAHCNNMTVRSQNSMPTTSAPLEKLVAARCRHKAREKHIIAGIGDGEALCEDVQRVHDPGLVYAAVR